jgi:hypothetical protein
MPTRSSLVARCGATLLLVMFAGGLQQRATGSPAGAQGSPGRASSPARPHPGKRRASREARVR